MYCVSHNDLRNCVLAFRLVIFIDLTIIINVISLKLFVLARSRFILIYHGAIRNKRNRDILYNLATRTCAAPADL